jgi:hypothetical protein
MKKILVPVVLVLTSTLLSFGVAEIILRLAYLNEPWTTRNFTVDRVDQQRSNIAIAYDPTIGYTARPGYRDGTHSHGERGVRLNQTLEQAAPLPPLPTGGILAVGDSFTFGSEVKDAESWPAQLEKMIGIPVVNGGAGGYGIDQAELRAEQLLDVVKPRAIVLSFIPNCVGRNEYSVNTGLIKPYFDVVNGKLELKNVPVPDYRPSRQYIGRARKIFGYSYALLWVTQRVGLGERWQMTESEVRRVHTKGAEVACLLWPRLAEKAAGRDIKLFVLAQYAGIQVNGHDNARDSYKVQPVLDCAQRAGWVVIDSYDELRRRFERDEKSFWPLWVRQPHDKKLWHTGHMSVEGNRLTAELVAASIRRNLPDLAKR